MVVLNGKTKTAVLEVQNLAAGYVGVKHALCNLSLKVEPGERVGILGPNGAGKSTFFKAVAGLIPLQAGKIYIHGQPHTCPDVSVGYVAQSDEVDWRFPVTVREVVMMGLLRQVGFLLPPRRRHWQKVETLLERVGMSDFAGRPIGSLSGGQRRRVFIARALAQDTPILLLDEPFSGLDVHAEAEISDLLLRLSAEGVTQLISTHDLGVAETFFDKILLLKREPICYGTPAEVMTPDYLRQAYGRRVGVVAGGVAVVD